MFPLENTNGGVGYYVTAAQEIQQAAEEGAKRSEGHRFSPTWAS